MNNVSLLFLQKLDLLCVGTGHENNFISEKWH